MRILRFIPYFSREFGGPVNHAQYLTRELERRGHEHTIYTTNLANRSGETMSFADSEFDVQAFSATQVAGDYFVTPGLVNAMQEESDFDLIHAHCYRNFQADVAAALARLSDTPYVLTAHGTIKAINRRDAVVKGFHDVATLKSGLRWADRCIAVAEAEVEQYTDKGVPADDVEVIHHGVDVDRFSPDVDGTPFVEEYGLEDTRFVLYAGRLHERKGLQYLIPAIDELAEEHPDVELVIAGPDYGFEDDLRELCVGRGCEDRVHFVGHLDQDTLIQAYNAAYLVCYPSKFEIFGHTLTEASACGTPCVAMGWGAAQQIVQDGETGRLLERYGDLDHLVTELGTLLATPNDVAQMGQQARQHIVEEFSWDVCATAHETMYQTLTTQR